MLTFYLFSDPVYEHETDCMSFMCLTPANKLTLTPNPGHFLSSFPSYALCFFSSSLQLLSNLPKYHNAFSSFFVLRAMSLINAVQMPGLHHGYSV